MLKCFIPPLKLGAPHLHLLQAEDVRLITSVTRGVERHKVFTVAVSAQLTGSSFFRLGVRFPLLASKTSFLCRSYG